MRGPFLATWHAEWETITHARAEIDAHIDHYHYHCHCRPHSRLGYRTPLEVAATWRPNPEKLQNVAT